MRLAVAGALALGSMAAPGLALAGEPPIPGECPAFKALSQVSDGATGNGWTVERGTTPKRFRFEVLGIVRDGIAPGRDMVIVEVSDAAGSDMFARIEGIWAGMSGSPVYLGDKLLGAISYGFSAGPTLIGGVTPAIEMADLLDYGTAAATKLPATVAVPTSMRAELAARAGISTAQADSFHRLAVPFSVSGLNARGRTQLSNELEARSINAIVASSSKAPRTAGTTISSRPAPGGNFAGVVSYGDVTVGAIGTTTYVCGDNALAFGHPLAFQGAVGFGANNATALAVVDDPTLTPFKLANITGLFGKLDQDRLPGIRAKLNSTPAMRPVRSHVTNVDTGASRNGRSDVTMSDWVPSVAPLHLLANMDSVFDHVGRGSSVVSWTIKGLRSNGNAFQVDYANRYASLNDLSQTSVFQLADQLAMLDQNRFTAVRFTSVDVDASLDDTFRSYIVESAKISRNGGQFRSRSSLAVSPGDNLRIRVTLQRYRGTDVTQTLEINVPNDVEPGSFGSLNIRGGGDFFGEPPADVNSFGQLVSALENADRNDDLIAELGFFDFDTFEPLSATSDTTRMNAVVEGSLEIGVDVQ